MRASIVVASHNEGELLCKTVESTVRLMKGLDCELLIADDNSCDGSVDEVLRRFPQVRVERTRTRRGVSYTKDFGARKARGDVLVFLDGHCKPERWSISRLIRDVEELDGEAIVTPRIPALHAKTWTNKLYAVGFGFGFSFEEFDCEWIHPDDMRKRGQFYETPSLVGCSLAVSRKLYRELRGFDPHMREWGVEDLDFSLKAWLMGYPVLNDPRAAIGHRFRDKPAEYKVDPENVVVNKLRMARKNLSDRVWEEWLRQLRSRLSRKPYGRRFWNATWKLFTAGKQSIERERRYLMAHRVRDEYWYADRFGLEWPRRRR